MCSALTVITKKGTVMSFDTTLLLPLSCGFYPVVSCCQLLNNSELGFCNTLHAASTDTNSQPKTFLVLRHGSDK